MGLFSSRFRGEEPEDALDRLEADIKRIERDSRRRQQTRTQVTKYSLVIFVIVFVVFIIAYTATVPKMDWTQALLYGLPLIVIPLSFLLLRTAIVHYYRCVLKKNKIMLIEKREEKRKKLEEVRNTSVYAVARNILDRYGGPEDDLDPLIYGDDI